MAEPELGGGLDKLPHISSLENRLTPGCDEKTERTHINHFLLSLV